jgi:hypothetical protein
MFTYPQGTDPNAFYQQQIASGSMPEFAMEESGLYHGGDETGPAPWAIPPAGPGGQALAPDQAEQAIHAMNAAKVAADNAARAAKVGAPNMAAQNAATAVVAAQVASAAALDPMQHHAAERAKNEATRAVAAANIAADNAKPKQGLNDWLELSGLGNMGGPNLMRTALWVAVGFAVYKYGWPWFKKQIR